MAVTTQQPYLDTFEAILALGVRKQYLPSNPALGVKPIAKETVAPDERRLPFDRDQIRAFFYGEFYQACAPDAVEPYKKVDKAWRFWLPLVMLFSGARPNEICQLYIGDVKRTEKGTWYFDFLNEDENQSRKTATSRRRIPIHQELIRLGFLKFVDERRKKYPQDNARLFSELKASKARPTNFAWYPSKRFNEVFLGEDMHVRDRQSLYSIRHSVRDALRRIKASDEALLAIGGWAPAGGKAVSSNYGSTKDPDLWVEEVNGIAYEGLDLSYLYPDDDPAIRRRPRFQEGYRARNRRDMSP